MWTTDPLPNVLRYLFVLRVNRPIVRLPAYPALEFSLVLGTMLADRLPTKEARAWRKSLEPWQEYQGEILSAPPSKGQPPKQKQRTELPPRKNPRAIPDIAWPLDVVIHVYPGKTFYNQGEVILWECRLIGEQADHALFLEKILPTVEAAGATRDKHWYRDIKLWGRYEIEGLYVARGQRWEPLAEAGRLDLSVRPTTMQWAEGLPFTMSVGRSFRKVAWYTPVDLSNIVPPQPPQQNRRRQANRQRSHWRQQKQEPPTLYTILAATAQRLGAPVPLWHLKSPTREEAMAGSTKQPSVAAPEKSVTTSSPLSAQTISPQRWEEVLALAQQIPIVHSDLRLPPKGWPGQVIGTQTYDVIPPELLPYLTLASIINVGRFTHFGCGGFSLLL